MDTGNLDQPGQPSEVQRVVDISAREVQRVAEGTEGTVHIAGVEVEASQAAANLNRALMIVRTKLGGRVNINLDDIMFRSLDGNVVGESVANATLISPLLLLHPVMRLVHVLAHELAHKNDTIQNEVVVEGLITRVFGETDLEHGHKEGVAQMEKFAAVFPGGAEKVYDLYVANNCEELYTGLVKDRDDTVGHNMFVKTFPELHFDGKKPGYAEVKSWREEVKIAS